MFKEKQKEETDQDAEQAQTRRQSGLGTHKVCLVPQNQMVLGILFGEDVLWF